MKKVKNKYIRLTEEELKRIIGEAVKHELSLINEYAIKRKDYKLNFWYVLPQILENWCLIHYCTITNTDVNSCKRHWKVELDAVMSRVADDDIKGNNSVDSRLKVLMEVIDEKDFKTIPSKVRKIVTKKFIKEGISVTSQEFNATINDCVGSLDNIVVVIARKEVEEYIETI